MGKTAYRKALHLRPDNDLDAANKSSQLTVCIGRDSISILEINTEFKAIQLVDFEFPFSSDDTNWATNIKSILESEEFISIKGEMNVNYWVVDQDVTMVPNALVNSDSVDDVFNLLFDNLKAGTIQQQQIESAEALGLYSVPDGFSNVLKSEPKSAYLNWVDQQLTSTPKGTTATLVIKNRSFALILTKGGELQFSNWFNYSKPEDVLYFLMASLEALNILHSDVTVKMCGQVSKGDEIHTTLGRFISKIEFASRPKNLGYSYSFSKTEEHRYPFLFAAACA